MSNSPQFPAVHLPLLEQIQLPLVQRAALNQPCGEPLADPEQAIFAALTRSQRLNRLPTGSRVALAVGSRGIGGIERVVKAAVGWLRDRGLQPFIVPAMGSHGGASAAGQEQVLAKLGITEANVGAPVEATMEVVDYGATRDGIRCYFDAHAAAADAVVLIARVKSHTSFDRPIESGLCKMIAVGLGKDRGARSVHVLGPRGLSEVLPELAAIAIEHAPLYGLALVEDSQKQLVTLEGVEPAGFFEADERLLKQAKGLLAQLPFAQLDTLIVEWVGKEISGAGMDYAVTARTDIRGLPNPDRPFIHKLGVLGLTEQSGGNGIGLGTADYITRRAAHTCDLQQMYTNALVSAISEKARLPIVLPSDREVLAACVATCWRADPENARAVYHPLDAAPGRGAAVAGAGRRRPGRGDAAVDSRAVTL